MSRVLAILLLLFIAPTIAHTQPRTPPECVSATMPAITEARFKCIDWSTQQSVRPLFDDEFASLSLHDIWRRGDNWQLVAPDTPSGRGGANFREIGDQWWTNPFNPNTPVPGGPRPAPLYQIDSNGLKLALLPAPSRGQPYISSQCRCTNMKYVGALLNSSQTSRHRFGYVEMQVAVDRLPGFTFQADEEAQPFPLVWPPEIDFPLIYTDVSSVQWMKIQVSEREGKTQSYTRSTNDGFDASVMHTYGVDWQANFITFYVDGAQVFRVPTPTDGSYTNYSMYWYLLTGANYQQTSPIDPNPASLPVYAHMRYFRAYARRP